MAGNRYGMRLTTFHNDATNGYYAPKIVFILGAFLYSQLKKRNQSQSYRKAQNSFQIYGLLGEKVLPILCAFSAYKLAKSWQSFADDM